MELNVIDQIKRFQEFIEVNYYNSLLDKARRGERFLLIDFSELSKFDPDLATELLDAPEETIKAIEKSVEQFDIEGLANFRIRFHNLPGTQSIMIRNIRSEHINRLLCIQGLVRQKSDVRPQVTSARFECPMCGNIMNVLQLEGTFKEPSRCGCGRKGKFVMLDKDLVDAQGIVLEEASENLEGGEQPKRFNVLLTNDLVSPISEKRMSPGSKVEVTGIVKEVPIISKSGGKSTRFDLMMESNYIKPMQDNFHDIKITEEEEKQILEIANDPNGYEKLVNSIAPSIYGYEKIKEALLLQLMGGVRKVRSDNVVSRGDFHILLVGDPGCIAGDSQVALVYKGMEQIKNLGKGHLQPIKEIVTKIRKHSKDKFYDFATLFHFYRSQPVLRVVTETGKELVCTYNQPLLTKNGWQRADELLLETEIRVMPKVPNKVKNLVQTNFTKVPKKSGHLKNVSIPDKFTPELASLCGYIIGDGHVNKRGYSIACYVNNEEKDLVENIFRLWKSSFNVHPSVYIKENDGVVKTIDDGNGLLRQFVSTQQMHVLEVNSRQISQSLSFLADKRVPQQIFRSPNHVVARFISWLFEADGCAFGNGRGRTSIQLKSATHELLLDIQLLLLYFGIQSRIIEDNLCIRRSRDMEIFAKYIGFNSEKKKTALSNVLEVIKIKSDVQKRKSPQRYEKVVKILPAGIRDVYDFEVPVSHMFIANGIVCHNSGKSALLKRITTFAPKGRYVSGKGVSGAGLTAAVVRDEFLRGWALEAGAMVLSSDGLVCVDELDKMTNEDRAAMHEALENQSYHPDTEIMLSDGSVFKIGDFVDELIEKNRDKIVLGKDCEILNVDGVELLTTDFEKIFPINAKMVSRHKAPSYFIKISYSNGRSITVTPEHPVFVFLNEKILEIPAENVKAGLLAPAPRRLLTKSENIEIVSGELIQLLNSEIKFIYIKNVEKVENEGIEWVYDVTVEPTRTFISEGLVLHNTVSISKANIQATLIARTTVLAAANPKFGRFDPYGIIADQIDLPPTLINRFDLIFPIKDLPEEVRDEKMAKHILTLHQNPEVNEPEISTEILRKYIAYARQKIVPILTDGALEEIKNFYLTMRKSGGSEGGIKAIPISARQLEALVRLSEASARSRLDSRVTRKDSKKAIELIEYCLMQVGLDRETGKIDIDRIATGVGATQRSHIMVLKEIISELESKLGKAIPIEDVVAEAKSRGLDENKVEEALERLKRSGDVYEPRRGFIGKL